MKRLWKFLFGSTNKKRKRFMTTADYKRIIKEYEKKIEIEEEKLKRLRSEGKLE